MQLKNSLKVDIDDDYVFFKNNCPMSFNLYDSFSICSIKTGDVKYWIANKCPYEKTKEGEVALWTVCKIEETRQTDPNEKFPTWHFNKTKDLIKFLNGEI